MENNNLNDLNELNENENGKNAVYVSYADKYEDVKSSAATFMLVGVVGLILMILLIAKVIKLPILLTTFFYVVMTTVFVVFIIIGIISFINAAGLKKKIAEDTEISSRVKAWLKENITPENTDSLISDEISEDEKFFERINIIKEKIALSECADMDEARMDALIEEFYNEIF